MATPSIPPSPCATTSDGHGEGAHGPLEATRNLIGPGRSVKSIPPPGVKARSHGWCRPERTVDTVSVGQAAGAAAGSHAALSIAAREQDGDERRDDARGATGHGGPPWLARHAYDGYPE